MIYLLKTDRQTVNPYSTIAATTAVVRSNTKFFLSSIFFKLFLYEWMIPQIFVIVTQIIVHFSDDFILKKKKNVTGRSLNRCKYHRLQQLHMLVPKQFIVAE